MSVINDALKRARKARPAGATPAAGPALRPVEGARRPVDASLWTLALLVVVILGLSGALLWAWYHGGRVELHVRANTAVPVSRAPVPANIPPTVTPPAAGPATNAPETSVTSIVAVAPPAVVQTFKLQSLFYRAQNPSAVINAQTVFVGSRVDGARVTVIGRDSVTIVTSDGRSRVLDLSQ